MKQTLHLRLVPTPAQQQALLETMHAFNAACTYLAEQAFAAQTANIFELQARAGGALREQFKLPLRLAFRAIFTICERYERNQRVKPAFPAEASMLIDEQIVSFQGITQVSLLTISGRLQMPFLVERARRAAGRAVRGQTALRYQAGQFFLAVTLEADGIVQNVAGT